MARGKKHDPEVRAAVIATLLAGNSVNVAARLHDIDPSVVSRWKRSIPEQELQQVAIEKQQNIGELVEQHLRTSLTACNSLANAAQDDAWVSRQSAHDLAVFYGVLSDKAFRLLEAGQRARERDRETDGEVV